MNRFLRMGPALAVVVLAGAGATPAQAALSPARVATGAGFDVEDFAVAMNPSGERSALVVAGLEPGSRTRHALLVARLGRGRSFGPGRRLEDLRASSGARGYVKISDPKVAVAPDGTAVAAWVVTTASRTFGSLRESLRVATAAPGKPFGRPRTVLTPTRTFPAFAGVVAGRGGLAVLCWERGGQVEVAVRRGGGRFGATQRIGSSSVDPPTLALAPGGSVIAAWPMSREAATVFVATAAVLPSNARRFRAARSVSPAGEQATFARAVAGPGGAGVAWKLQAPLTDPRRAQLRFARLRTATGAFGAPSTLSDDRAQGAPHVALPRLGVATAWRRYSISSEPGDTDSFVNPRLAATASWLGDLAPRRLAGSSALPYRPVLAALTDRALIAWREAPAYDLGTVIRLAVAGPNGWQGTRTLPSSDAVGRRTQPATAIDEDEHQRAGDLAIAGGRRSAVLAWVTLADGDEVNRIGTLRIASYRP